LQSIEPNIAALIPQMPQPPHPLAEPAVWMTLINTVAASAKEFVVILDDYHLVEAREVHEALDSLIEHLPANMHLVISTRADPPLSLPRLRARGHLTELRLGDLRFSADETADFFMQTMDLGLSARDLAALETRTEGWIAALQMAALSLQMHSPDLAARSEYIQTFTGSHRFILDYLVDEVLEQQPADLRSFLLKTSILERLNGLLCDAVLKETESGSEEQQEKPSASGLPLASSQSILEYLESVNLLIIPLDDERLWYRYHRLFSDLLRKRLWQTSPGLVPILHSRASDWFAQQGMADEAIDHALAAKSFERAAALIEDHVETTLMRSEVRTFLNWMETLPEEYARTRPRLSFFYSWALLMSGQSPELVERRLQALASLQGSAEGASSMAGRMAALRAYLSLFQADFDLAARLCQQALQNLPEDELFLRSIVTWILSMIEYSDRGQQDGRQALDKVVRMSQEAGNPLIAVAALSHRARMQMRQGRLQLAHETLEQALKLAADPRGRRLPIASEALIVLGDLEREWNNLDQAAQYLTESIELARQWNELSSFDAYYPLMRLRLAQGDVAAAREAVETAWQMAHNSDFSQIDDSLADLQRANFFVMQRNGAEAVRWAEKHGLVPGVAPENRPALDQRQEYINAHLRKYELLVLARAFILQGRSAEALELLETLIEQARQLDRTDLAIELYILKALALQLEGRADPACAAIVEALSLAEPGGYVRTFLDEGEPMIRLLRQAASRGISPAYLAKLLAAFGESTIAQSEAKPSSPHALVDPLSDREVEVLRLLAAGMSNPEIAGELFVAVSTIRTHCKNIYEKLGVHRRWDAVQRAQELGLI
jgi:LuxR family maltose regulon positive regulatory protein